MIQCELSQVAPLYIDARTVVYSPACFTEKLLATPVSIRFLEITRGTTLKGKTFLGRLECSVENEREGGSLLNP